MTKLRRQCGGFLLIELGVALALIGMVVVIISVGVAHAVALRHDTAARLNALDYARDIAERLSLGLAYDSTRGELHAVVSPFDCGIDQRAIDECVSRPAGHEELTTVSAYSICVSWQGASGQRAQVILVTACERAREAL